MPGIDLSGLMTDEVLQMMHWYCARSTPRETQLLEVVNFAIQHFFSPKYSLRQRSESNNIGDWLMQSKKDGKDQESIQSIHLTQDTNGKVTNSQLDITDESLEVRTIYKYITLVYPPQCFLMALSRGERMLRG